MTRIIRGLLPVAGVLLGFPSSAHAQQNVIDFETLACPGAGFTLSASPLTFNGFSFATSSSSGVDFGNWCTGNGNFAGSTGIAGNIIGATTTLTKVGGGAFRLSAIDLATLFGGGTSFSLTFTGFLANSTQVFQSFLVPGSSGSPVFTQFLFGNAFANVVAVTWTQDAPFHQFDNVTVGSINAVPEPATVALMAIGLVGVGAAAYRRRKKRADV